MACFPVIWSPRNSCFFCWFSSYWKCWWTILEIVFMSRWLIQELFLYLWKLWRKRWVFLHTLYRLLFFSTVKFSSISSSLSLSDLFLCFQSDLPVRERIFLLLDATQTSLGGASGKFPQYYNAYYELVVGTVQICEVQPLGFLFSSDLYYGWSIVLSE